MRGADLENFTSAMNRGANTAHTSGTGVTRHSASSEDATYTLHTRGGSPVTGTISLVKSASDCFLRCEVPCP
jgi:hypothetical protein